jgi:hypothetical protein
VVNGYEETRQLRKLLTSLYNKLFPKTTITWEDLVDAYALGETPRQTDPELDYIVEDIIDEETGRFIRIRIVCACDEPVMRIGGEGFKCLHCDQPCYSGKCQKCQVLFSVDYG